MGKWVENNIWVFSLVVALVVSPLAIWGAWDGIAETESTTLRLVECAGIVAFIYVSIGLLLMWNRWVQRKYREKGIIK